MMDLKIRVPDSCFLWMGSHWNGQHIFLTLLDRYHSVFVSNFKRKSSGYSWCLLVKNVLNEVLSKEIYRLYTLFVCAFFSYHFHFFLFYELCRKNFEWRC